MASDRGQNRYSDFVALETLLRFENCSSSHCLLSSWCRFHVFESSHPSFRRIVFFGAPLAFLRGFAMGLCRRCLVVASLLCLRVVGSSFRQRYMPGCRLYLHKLYLPFFAWYLVTLLPCYLVTLLPYCSVPRALSPRYSVVIFYILVYFCMTNHNFFSRIDALFCGGGGE